MIRFSIAVLSSLTAVVANAAMFTPGNLAIYRVGTGTAAVNNTATEVFVDEYTTGGTLVQTIAMPTPSGSNRRLTAQGNATLEGFINRSTDGQYLILTGFDKAVGGSAPASDDASVTNRIVGRIDAAGNVNTSTVINSTGTGSIRSAISTNGTDLWVVSGNTAPNGGIHYTMLGATGSTQLNALETRHIDIFGGQLYGSTSITTGGRTGVFAIGNGTPTTAGQSLTNLTGVASGAAPGGAGQAQFFMADLDGTAGIDTLYAAGDGVGRITKYSFVSGSWVSNGTIASTTPNTYRGLTGAVSGNSVTLFSIRGANELVTLIDTSGFNGTLTAAPSLLATAATNTLFKGLDFAPVAIPEVAAFSMLGIASVLMGILNLRRRARANQPVK